MTKNEFLDFVACALWKFNQCTVVNLLLLIIARHFCFPLSMATRLLCISKYHLHNPFGSDGKGTLKIEAPAIDLASAKLLGDAFIPPGDGKTPVCTWDANLVFRVTIRVYDLRSGLGFGQSGQERA